MFIPNFERILVLLLPIIAKSYAQRGETVRNSGLNGRNLIVTSINSASGIIANKNATGHVITAQGIPVSMLQWLSQEYNFTFSYLTTNVTTIDSPGSERKGLIDYVVNRVNTCTKIYTFIDQHPEKGYTVHVKFTWRIDRFERTHSKQNSSAIDKPLALFEECDIVLPLIPTASRVRQLDFAHPFLYIPTSYLIPFGNPYANTSAVTKPFQLLVWITTVLAVAIISAMFYIGNAIIKWRENYYLLATKKSKVDNSMSAIHDYVLGVLLNQGGYCSSTKPSIRITAGCWCLASAVLVYGYSSVLISYLTVSNPNLLINNIEDLKERSDVFLITDAGLSTDVLLSTSESGLYKILGDKLRAYPKSRCNNTQQCLKMVKSGSHVYTGGVETYLTKAMKEDFMLTKQCNFRLGKKSYMNLELSWGVAKRSPFIQEINEGIMKIREFGLIIVWKKPYEADVSRCLRKAKDRPLNPRISLLHLLGAFTVLFVGYTSSFIALLYEVLSSKSKLPGYMNGK